MAHDYIMKLMEKSRPLTSTADLIKSGWDYADAMQAEADKRVAKLPDVFFDTKPNEKWQPDWNQAPEWAKYFAMDEDGEFYYFEESPSMAVRSWQPQSHGELGETFDHGYKGDWQDSLRKRPFKKEPIIDWSNAPKDAIAYKIVDGIVQYLHGTRSSDGTLCGGYLANDGWIKLENRP